MILLLPEQLQDEVPKLDLSGPGARLWLVSPFWKGKPWMDQESNGLVGCDLNSSRNNTIGVGGRHCLYKVSYLFKGHATQTKHFWQCRQNFKVSLAFIPPCKTLTSVLAKTQIQHTDKKFTHHNIIFKALTDDMWLSALSVLAYHKGQEKASRDNKKQYYKLQH